MVVKITGIVLVCVSSGLLGMYYSYKDDYRLEDLTFLKQALLMLRAEIGFAVTGLPEALSNISERMDKQVGMFFRITGERLAKRSGAELAVVWEKALVDALPGTYLIEEDVRCLSRLGVTLGYLDRDMQLAGIDLAIEHIDGAVSLMADRSQKNRRMYKSVGILCGILAVIMFL